MASPVESEWRRRWCRRWSARPGTCPGPRPPPAAARRGAVAGRRPPPRPRRRRPATHLLADPAHLAAGLRHPDGGGGGALERLGHLDVHVGRRSSCGPPSTGSAPASPSADDDVRALGQGVQILADHRGGAGGARHGQERQGQRGVLEGLLSASCVFPRPAQAPELNHKSPLRLSAALTRRSPFAIPPAPHDLCSPRPLRALPHRLPPHRRRPHRAVQLALCPATTAGTSSSASRTPIRSAPRRSRCRPSSTA